MPFTMSALESTVWLSCMCYLLALTGGTVGQQHGVKVVVEEGSDAVLPCLISTKEDISGKLFDWKKDGQKDIFMFDRGSIHKYIDGVSHFEDQLKYGNASITIKNVKLADRGNYTCIFPRLQSIQRFPVELVVGQMLRDRSVETTGASPKPHITTLDQTKDWSLLQCEVRRASPKPKVEWQDSAGNILPAEEPQVSERGGSYYVTLNITVTKTDRYSCVVTQEEISHQIDAKTFVFISGDSSNKEAIGLLFGVFVLGAAVLAVVLTGLIVTKYITIIFNKGPCRQRNDYEAPPEKSPTSSP